jgi:hypothetical protein
MLAEGDDGVVFGLKCQHFISGKPGYTLAWMNKGLPRLI